MNAPLRVLAVTNIWPVGDSYRGIYVKEQVDALRRIGVNVDVEVVAQERGKPDYVLAAPRVWYRARRGNYDGAYDLVHVHFGMTALAGRFTGGLPRVVSLYGSDVNTGWKRMATRLGGAGRAQARIYVSQNLADNYGDRVGEVIADGVDLTLFTPAEQRQARAELGVDTSDKLILFGGHPDNWVKGYDVFTDVLAELRRRGENVQELILAADGQPRTTVPRKFAAADLMLFTSRKGSEGSPSVIKEATVMGLPVVTVAIGDARKLLDGVTPSAVVDFPEPWGSAAAPEPASRAQLVRELADQCARVLATGQRSNGRERNSWLDAERVAERVVQVYQRVLAASR